MWVLTITLVFWAGSNPLTSHTTGRFQSGHDCNEAAENVKASAVREFGPYGFTVAADSCVWVSKDTPLTERKVKP